MPAATVLVVDDHADSRMICEIILARHDYRILSASDGRTALALAREQAPDAIVLDIALPHMDGWAVIEELKKEPATARIPVVLYTAHFQDVYRARAMELGCSAYLVKPCPPRAILDAVRECIESPPAHGLEVPEPA
jgi:CheY-like chemotaxis protein